MLLHFYRTLLILVAIIFLTACSFQTQVLTNKNYKNTGDYVVVLHGIHMSNWHTHSLAKFLAKNGYEVINISYPSTKYDLHTLKTIVIKDIKNHILISKPVHFVGFSLGGLVLRAVLKDYRPKKMGRVVFIGTPNHGSELADLVQKWPAYKFLYGPSGQQLITDQSQFNDLFAPVNYQLGIIAGYRSIDLLMHPIFKDKNDGMVSVKSTVLKGAQDCIAIKSLHHVVLTWSPEIQRQTLYFIQNGRFFHKTRLLSTGRTLCKSCQVRRLDQSPWIPPSTKPAKEARN